MKQYRYLLISILFLFFQSCQEDNEPLEYHLENLDATIKLPNTYKLASKERLARIIARKEDEQFKKELLAMIHKKGNIKMLIDTLNPYKFILFTQKVPYTKIDTISMYVLFDNERRKSSSGPEVNDSTYFVGSRIDSTSSFKFIEFKYKRKSGNKRRTGYTFMISDDIHTSGISFFGPEKQDARKYVKTIVKKKKVL